MRSPLTDAPHSAGLVALADRIELWPIDRLRPYERNPRTHSDEQVDQLAASMVEFGWTNPVLVDEQGGVVEARVTRSAGTAFDEAALHAAAGLRFNPARLGDEPVSVRLPFLYRFEPPAAAPVPTTVITGRVRGKGTRQFLTEASLTCEGVTVLTDAEGHFAFSGHRLHRLYLEASKEGSGRIGQREYRLYFKGQNMELDEPLQLRPEGAT